MAVAASLAVAGGAAGGVLVAHAHAATNGAAAAPKARTVSAKLTASKGSAHGAVTGRLTAVNATSGTLAWKLTFAGTKVPAATLRLGKAGKVLVHLCGPCSSGVHKAVALHGATYKAVAANKSWVVAGTLSGVLKLGPAAPKSGVPTGGNGGGAGATGGTTVPVTPATIALGKKYVEKYSCEGCHTITGAKSTGPTWKGLAGSKQHLTDGSTVVATDAYLIGIITDPSTAKVAGYDSGVMAEVIAPGEVSDAEARDIVAYIKSLK